MKKIRRFLKRLHWHMYIADLVTLYNRRVITYAEYQKYAAKAEEELKKLDN